MNKEKSNSNRIDKEKASHKRAVLFDKLARITINSGGVAIILAILGILIFILIEAYPLFISSKSSLINEIPIDENQKNESAILTGIDDYREIIYVITDSLTVDFISVESRQLINSKKIIGLENDSITAAARNLKNDWVAIGLSNGKAVIVQIKFNVSFDENNNRVIIPEVEAKKIITLNSSQKAIDKIQVTVDDQNQPLLIALTSDNRLIGYAEEYITSLIGEVDTIEHHFELPFEKTERISAIALDNQNEKFAVSTTRGNLFYYSLKNKSNPELLETIKVGKTDFATITALGYIFGDQSLIVGDSEGNLTSWILTLDESSATGRKLNKVHEFPQHNGAVNGLVFSARNKSFISYDVNGGVHLNYLTSENKLFEFETKQNVAKDIAFAVKGDGAVILYNNGTLAFYDIDNPHPEISFKTLFGKVWYEGYKKPEYVWQSTGGTDDFESKFSLIPLIFGTLKGTLYAMIFAIPLALLGALYTSAFSHPKFKNLIKPVVEIMAALPSVVIGFLAGLWLAPILEKYFPGVMLMFFILPVVIIVGIYLWRSFHKTTGINLKVGFEILIIIPLILIGIQTSLWLGPWFETTFLNGDYRLWLSDNFNQNYDQRNSIVVGFAMGFAVIPIIFTICEDSLSSVPDHLKSASLALGANRWQTAFRVILPTASPGIFSAIMIGFGRAVGETMIVLMATGNTPILDLSPFNGMRTLSANIAVEIPEAPYHGTLYRVLFLSAALLFVLTFIVNTAAEIVRQRLRKKYMHI